MNVSPELIYTIILYIACTTIRRPQASNQSAWKFFRVPPISNKFEHFSSRANFTLGDQFAISPKHFEDELILAKNKMIWTVETVQKMLNSKEWSFDVLFCTLNATNVIIERVFLFTNI